MFNPMTNVKNRRDIRSDILRAEDKWDVSHSSRYEYLKVLNTKRRYCSHSWQRTNINLQRFDTPLFGNGCEVMTPHDNSQFKVIAPHKNSKFINEQIISKLTGAVIRSKDIIYDEML